MSDVSLPPKFRPLSPWFERHRRDCWKPVVADDDGGAVESKFAGRPWLADGEPWPTCGNCEEPMWFFAQLDLDQLPDAAAGRYGSGLLQAFFCVHDDCLHGESSGEPFADTHLLRVVDPALTPGGARPPVGLPAPDGEEHYPPLIPPRRIVGWDRRDDYPSLAEQEDLGLVLDDRVGPLRCDDPPVEVPDTTLDELFALPGNVGAEKVGGWPGWCNVSTAYPDCPRCGRRMDVMIFQMGHDGFVPVMFGDGGQGHVVQCPEHKDVLAYPWTCG